MLCTEILRVCKTVKIGVNPRKLAICHFDRFNELRKDSKIFNLSKRCSTPRCVIIRAKIVGENLILRFLKYRVFIEKIVEN